MALKLIATPEKKILIQGTTVQIPNVYVRLEYACRIDGSTMEVAPYIFQDKPFFEQRLPIGTDIPVETLLAVAGVGEIQGLIMAEKYTKLFYEDKGYIVEIVD